MKTTRHLPIHVAEKLHPFGIFSQKPDGSGNQFYTCNSLVWAESIAINRLYLDPPVSRTYIVSMETSQPIVAFQKNDPLTDGDATHHLNQS